jgi:hypothetical protein
MCSSQRWFHGRYSGQPAALSCVLWWRSVLPHAVLCSCCRCLSSLPGTLPNIPEAVSALLFLLWHFPDVPPSILLLPLPPPPLSPICACSASPNDSGDWFCLHHTSHTTLSPILVVPFYRRKHSLCGKCAICLFVTEPGRQQQQSPTGVQSVACPPACLLTPCQKAHAFQHLCTRNL